MTISAAVIDALITAGATAEMLAAAMKADAAQEEARLAHKRSVNAERQRRLRASRMSRDVAVTERDSNAMSQAVTATSVTPPLSPETKAPTPPKTQPLSPQESIPKGIPKNPQPTPRIELETVLDIEHAEAVIDHRRQLRPPLSVRAAKLLAGKFARCADPNAAADAMIANGWRGFEPEWLENRIRPNSTGPPRKLRGSAALSELASRPISEVFGNTFDGPSVNPNGNFAARNGR